MLNLRHRQTRRKLDQVGLDTLAHQTRFDSGYTKKIRAFDFLMGFFLMYNSGANSLESWASCIGATSGAVVSKQALALKFEPRHLAFVKALTAALLAQDLPRIDPARQRLLAAFNRVLIEDSTCVKLHPSLAEVFPSSYQRGAAAATARLQLRYELKQERIVALALQSYRDNDQKHAPALVEHLGAGDLVLRDLGYFSTGVFQQIAQRQGFFLSRLHHRVNLYQLQTGQQLELRTLMRGRKRIDLEVGLGSEHRWPVRLVGLRLPEAVAKRRRRKAKQNRHSKANPSARYMALLGWNFFVTNVPASCWRAEALGQVYRLRWRIEMVFKTLKSELSVGRMLAARKLPRARVEMTIYLMVIYGLLFVWGGYRSWLPRMEGVSLLKYARWLRLHFVVLLQSPDWSVFEASVRRHCRYERRRKRANFHELMQAS